MLVNTKSETPSTSCGFIALPSRRYNSFWLVRDHEPRQALDGAGDGLFFYRRIVAESEEYLPGGSMLFFEIGYDQAEAVSRLMEEAGFLEINVVKDYAGLDRVVYGTKSFAL